MEELNNCLLCPRECGVNRNTGTLGYCGSDAGYHIASICLHRGEEPAISGPHGICNVFFAGCNLQCLYCQNYQISRRKSIIGSKSYSLEQVTGEIISYLDQGIQTVGFVSPTHFTPHVKAIINRLNKLGYTPVTVYNTNAYDKAEVLKSLEGFIDVYLPDFKYFDSGLAETFSDCRNYPEIARNAFKEIYRQKGSTVVLNDNGQAVMGMIIRHLVLPGQVEDSINILKWIAGELSPSVYISLMSQYYPTVCVANHPLLGKKVSISAYQQVLEVMEELGFHKGWIQQYESTDYYQPDFTHDHPFETL